MLPAKLLFIVLVNLVLSGDNGLLIAMALKSAAPGLRSRILVIAALCDVAARSVVTIFATRLLDLWFLRLAGGCMVIWIAIRLFREAESTVGSGHTSRSFWGVVWFVVVADLMMSTDNILAIAGLAEGNSWLLASGLALSVPMVLFGSRMLVSLMERYPAIVYFGAVILGQVGGEMIASDGFTVYAFHPTAFARHCLEALAVFGILSVRGGALLFARAGISSKATR